MSRTVTISGGATSLALLLPARGMPEIVAFGAQALDAEPLAHRASRINGMDVPVPSAVLLPTGGMGGDSCAVGVFHEGFYKSVCLL